MKLDLNMYEISRVEVPETQTREIVLIHKETKTMVDPIHLFTNKKFKLNLNSELFRYNPLDDDPCGTIHLAKLVGNSAFSIYAYATKYPGYVRTDMFSVYEKSIKAIAVGGTAIWDHTIETPWDFLFTVEEFVEFILNGDIYIY